MLKGAFLLAQRSRVCLPMQETEARSLDQEDPLEKQMAACPSALAWELSWTEEPGGLVYEVAHSCLGTPMDGEAWRASLRGRRVGLDKTTRRY